MLGWFYQQKWYVQAGGLVVALYLMCAVMCGHAAPQHLQHYTQVR